MVRCAVIIVGPGDTQKGAEQVFVALPRVGEETVVPVGVDTVTCRVDKVRHIAGNALRTSPQADITIFVSRV